MYDCYHCHGYGEMECLSCDGKGFRKEISCKDCNCTGLVLCPRCEGKGMLEIDFNECDSMEELVRAVYMNPVYTRGR